MFYRDKERENMKEISNMKEKEDFLCFYSEFQKERAERIQVLFKEKKVLNCLELLKEMNLQIQNKEKEFYILVFYSEIV